jgi:hypothetical protein
MKINLLLVDFIKGIYISSKFCIIHAGFLDYKPQVLLNFIGRGCIETTERTEDIGIIWRLSSPR